MIPPNATVVGAGVLPLAAKLMAVGPTVVTPSVSVTFQLVGVTFVNDADSETGSSYELEFRPPRAFVQ